LAKTTGSAPMAIIPDGSEREIVRPGPATILENKSIVRLAQAGDSEALVCEMMSITPECLRVESARLLKPDLLVITNVRLDHREEQGRTREEIARSLSSAIRPGCTVLVPEEDSFPVFEKAAVRVGAKLVRVPAGGNGIDVAALRIPAEFEVNVRLALAAADCCGLDRSVALAGMIKAKPDLGGLRILKARLGEPPALWHLASAFAANDPESTRLALAKLGEFIPGCGVRRSAILNLRQDRGDRTLQWLEALKGGFFAGFESVAIVGTPAVAALRRKVKRLARDSRIAAGQVIVLSERSPERITRLVTVKAPRAGGLIVGVGNMGGLGRGLLEHWERLSSQTEHGHA
jgi:poly-gamma-glutamate synthase PgsB/CapB